MAVAATAALLTCAARGQSPGERPGWRPADPAGALDDDNPSSVQALQFSDQLQNKGFHQFCDNLPLDVSYSHNDGLFNSDEQGSQGLLAGGEGGASRAFYHYPTGQLALIDRAVVGLSLGYAYKLIPSGREMPLGLILGSRVEGESLVIMPLEKNRSCEEIGKFLKVTEFKTVLPLNARRIAAMKVGELWKFPLSIQMSVGLKSAKFPAGPAYNAAFFVSLTHSKSRAAMATLYRLEHRKLRLRLRFDRVSVWNVAGGAIASPLPVILVGTPEAGKILGRVMTRFFGDFVADQVGDYLNRYMAAIISVSPWSHSDGSQMVLEYVLDPEDGERMEGLERALKGDLGPLTLLSAAGDLSRPAKGKDQDVLELLRSLEESSKADIGAAPSYAGVDHKTGRRGLGLKVKLPFIIDYDRGSGRTRDKIVTLDPRGGQLQQWSADRESSRAMVDIPFVGQLKRTQSQRGAQAVVKVEQDGSASAPFVVYIQQEGFLRGDEKSGRRLVAKANEVARYIGAPGGCDAGKQGCEIPAPGPRQPQEKPGRYLGNAALTVVLGQKALQEILQSSPARIFAAYAASLKGSARQAMEALIASGRAREDGRIVDPSGLFPDGGPMADLAERVAAHATGLIKDLRKAGAARTPAEQANRFVDLLCGRGASGLAYEAAIKVVAQLARPGDLSGEFWVFLIDKSGAGNTVASRYVWNPVLLSDPALKENSRANRRFMKPLRPAD